MAGFGRPKGSCKLARRDGLPLLSRVLRRRVFCAFRRCEGYGASQHQCRRVAPGLQLSGLRCTFSYGLPRRFRDASATSRFRLADSLGGQIKAVAKGAVPLPRPGGGLFDWSAKSPGLLKMPSHADAMLGLTIFVSNLTVQIEASLASRAGSCWYVVHAAHTIPGSAENLGKSRT